MHRFSTNKPAPSASDAAPAKKGAARAGFAILIVLWTLVLLSLIATHLAASGRSESRIAANLVANGKAESAADGLVYEALFRLLEAKDPTWAANGSAKTIKLTESLTVVIRIIPESAKINPNNAPLELLIALLREIGVENAKSESIAAAILDWRETGDAPRKNGAKLSQYAAAGLNYGPPGAPFERLEELSEVLGITPEILQKLLPHLSLFNAGQVDPQYADATIRAALKQAKRSSPAQSQQTAGTDPQNQETVETTGERGDPTKTVTILSDATSRDGGHFTRRAVVRLVPNLDTKYMILAWDSIAEPE